jgi:hypothetical protein
MPLRKMRRGKTGVKYLERRFSTAYSQSMRAAQHAIPTMRGAMKSAEPQLFTSASDPGVTPAF